jgi:hypothetical protein
MRRGIRISAIILSVFFISSCATDRIQVSEKKNIDCKTPETRYDFGKNKPIQAIKPNNRKYTRYVYYPARNNTHNSISSRTISKNDKHPGKAFYRMRETKNYYILTHPDINKQIFLQQILKSSEISLSNYEVKRVPDQVRIINEPKDIIISHSAEDILFPINKVNNESGYPFLVLKQEDTGNIVPDESTNETGVSILNAVRTDQTQKTPFRNRETFFLMMALLAGLIPLAAIKATPKLAANISFWAAKNPWKTRFMFAGIQIAMGTAGVLLGERLADNGVHFSDLSRDLLVGAFLTSSLLYPVKYSSIKFFKHSYLRQKAFDLALALSGFMLMVNAGNDPGMRATLTKMVGLKSPVQQNMNMLNDHSQVSKQLLYYQNDKQIQDEQKLPKNKERNRENLYTILTVVAAIVLGFLLALGACGIYCNGMVGLAFLVGFGGGGLLIWLMILTIRSIRHPKLMKKTKPAEGIDSIPQEGTLQT